MAQIGGDGHQLHLPALDAAHFQHVVDQRQQVAAGGFDLVQIIPAAGGQVLFPFCQGHIAHDGIHRGADIVAHIGKEGGLFLAALLRQGLVLHRRLMLLLHRGIDAEHDEQRHHEQHELDEGIPDDPPRQLVEAVGHHAAVALHLGFHFGLVFLLQDLGIVLPRLLHDRLGGLLRGAHDPDHGSEEDQQQQDDPDDGALSHAPGAVPPEDQVKDHEAQHGPQQEHQIGFHGEGGNGPDIGDQEIEQEENGESDAQDGGNQDASVLLGQGLPEGDGGGIGIGDGHADGVDVDDPADGRAPQEGDGQGDQNQEQDRVFRRALLVEGRHGRGKHIFPGHGIDHAAGGGHVPHQAGDDAGGGRHAQDGDAGVPHGVGCRVEGGQPLNAAELSQTAEVVHPIGEAFRLGRGCDQRKADVGDGGGEQGDDHDAEGLFDGETEFLRGMGHGFKAREGPGRQKHDEQNPRAGLVLRREQGLQGDGAAGAWLEENYQGDDGDAHDEIQGQQDLG